MEDRRQREEKERLSDHCVWLLSPWCPNSSMCSRYPYILPVRTELAETQRKPGSGCSLSMRSVQIWECKLLDSFCRVGGGASWQRWGAFVKE